MQRAGLRVPLPIRQVRLLQEVSGLEVGIGQHSAHRIHTLHDLSRELLYGHAFCGVALVVLGAESLRPLHPLRLAVYNGCGVVRDVKCAVLRKDVTRWYRPVLAARPPDGSDCATIVQRIRSCKLL